MTRWVFILVLAACTTTSEFGQTWGIAVTDELKTLLTDAELAAGLYSTPESFTLIGGKGVTPEIEALLDAYKTSKDFKFTEFPQSESFNDQGEAATEIVTYKASRGTYLDLVVDRQKEGVRVLRLFKTVARDRYAQVVVLREYDWERRTWVWVDEGLIANSAAIVGAWKSFEASLQRETTYVEYPVWANRAPGSAKIPFNIFTPPYSYFPEIN